MAKKLNRYDKAYLRMVMGGVCPIVKRKQVGYANENAMIISDGYNFVTVLFNRLNQN
jgi:hypothetical protein